MYSFYTIHYETKTKTDEHRGAADIDSKLLRKQWKVLCATNRKEVSQTLISKYYGNTKEEL